MPFKHLIIKYKISMTKSNESYISIKLPITRELKKN